MAHLTFWRLKSELPNNHKDWSKKTVQVFGFKSSKEKLYVNEIMLSDLEVHMFTNLFRQSFWKAKYREEPKTLPKMNFPKNIFKKREINQPRQETKTQGQFHKIRNCPDQTDIVKVFVHLRFY